MRTSNPTVYSIIALSLFIAAILTLWPLPGTMDWLRPAWVILVLIYWAIITPQRIDIGWAFMVGLLLDGIHGSFVGEHALACIICIYWVGLIRRQMLILSMPLQMLVINVLILIYQLLIYLVQGFAGQVINNWHYWLASLTSALFWPLIVMILRATKVKFRIY